MVYKRTHMCGELRISNVGDNVVLNGWIQKRRNLGGLIFCDVRDKTGMTQVIFNDETSDELFALADTLRSEYVVGVKGKVVERESKNPEMETGDIEVIADDLIIYSKSETPPIYIKDDDNVDDNLRLKYRYLDLRKKKMQDNLSFRAALTTLARNYYAEQGFTEVETPMLIKSTPEGARDYLVPSRINLGRFYALPQSPQTFKQLLMVGGTDRYFQIVKCFRDEDLRADRQPEFTQIDLEMSFVDVDDVIEIQEGFLKRVMKEMKGIDIATPFPRMTWEEAMTRYGSDKPDTRFGFELCDLTDKVKDCEFKVFTDAIAAGGSVRGICVTGGSDIYTRKKIDKLTEAVKSYGARGMVWIRKTQDGYKIADLDKVQGYYMTFHDDAQNEAEVDEIYAYYTKQLSDMFTYNREVLIPKAQEKPYVSTKSFAKAYDRNKAVAYADKYHHVRNPVWYNFTDEGGNCQNYASQCMLEGGIALDYFGEEQWKCYINDPDYDPYINEDETPEGRTRSWVNVGYFYNYAKYNEGKGLVAEANANLYYAQPSDIIMVGNGGLAHTVIVSKVVDGHILVDSNSIDMKDYPIEAYTYTDIMLIKILGNN